MMADEILDDFIIVIICTLFIIVVNILFIIIKKVSASNLLGIFDTLVCIILLNEWNETFRDLEYMSTIISWSFMIIYLIISIIGMTNIVQANADKNSTNE
jgi:hypothetical protein